MRDQEAPQASTVRPERSERAKPDDENEGGSAAAELLVLLPIYLLLIVVTLTMGQFVLIRQKIAMTVHLQAWTANPQDVTGIVFENYQKYGTYTASNVDPPSPIPGPDAQTQSTYKVKKTDWLVYQSDLPVSGKEWDDRIHEPAPSGGSGSAGAGGAGGSGGGNNAPPSAADSARNLAALALMDGATENGQLALHPHLEWRTVHGSFQYLPAFMPAMLGRDTAISPGCTCVTLARKSNVERKVYRQGGGKSYYVSDHNPIEDLPDSWAFPISKNPNQSSGSSQDNNDYRFLPPDFPSQAFNEPTVTPAMASSSGKDPGIWNTDFRIGGSEDQEWSFFKQQLGL